MLSQCRKGSPIYLRGRLRTEEGETGPRGGKTTKTRIRCVNIVRLPHTAAEPEHNRA